MIDKIAGVPHLDKDLSNSSSSSIVGYNTTSIVTSWIFTPLCTGTLQTSVSFVLEKWEEGVKEKWNERGRTHTEFGVNL